MAWPSPKPSPLDVAALWLGRVALAAIGCFVFLQTAVRLARRYVHFPAPAFISVVLESPLRKAIQPPEEVVARAGVEPGMTVLEVGCGPGTFTVEAARRAVPGGRVIAVDAQPAMLARLRRKLGRFGVANVDVYQADAYRLPLPDDSVDVALLVAVLAEIPDRARALAEIRRVLKPGGLLSISELLLDPDCPRRSTVTRWCEASGFRPEAGFGGVLAYTLNFRTLG